MNSFIEYLLKNKVSKYLSEEKENLCGFDFFNLAEGFLEPDPKIRDVLDDFSIRDLSHYLDPSYEKLRKFAGKNFKVKSENILPTSGADEAISFMPRFLAEPGDNALIVVPTFYRIAEANNLFKLKNHYLRLEEDDNFEYNDKFVKNLIKEAEEKKAKTITLTNPNNPTGNVLKKEQILDILNNINKNCFLIIDEVFFEFFDPGQKESAVNLINDYENLIVIKSLSKSYGLAGLRVGFIVANNKIIETANYIKPVFNINSLTEKIAIKVLEDKRYISEVSEIVKFNRNNLFKNIKYLNNYIIGGNSKANIFLLKHKNKDLYEELKENKILVADFRDSLGLEGKNYVRVALQNKEKNRKFFEVLKKLN